MRYTCDLLDYCLDSHVFLLGRGEYHNSRIVEHLYNKYSQTNPTGFSFSAFFKPKAQINLTSKHDALSPKPSSPSLSSLLTPRVVLAASNYALLSLVDIAYRALQPVYLATPPSLGGPGLSPRAIGFALALLGLGNGVFQVLCFARVVKWFGLRRCYLLGMWSAMGIFVTFPVMGACVWWGRNQANTNDAPLTPASTYALYAALALQLLLTIALNTCYGCIFIYINAAARSRRTLGATNGLAQMSVSIMRAIGPAAASALFSLSLELGGGGRILGSGTNGLIRTGELDGVRGLIQSWMVYGVMLLLVGISVGVGRMLPAEAWVREEETTNV